MNLPATSHRCPRCGGPAPAAATLCAACDEQTARTAAHGVDAEASTPTLPSGQPGAGTAPPVLPQVERYKLLEVLGEGGHGTVHLAFDEVLRRHVAYKVLKTGALPGADTVERFIAEGQAAAQLEHPAIVPIYDLGVRREDGAVYYTMKVVRGRTLKQHLQALRDGVPAPGITRYRLLLIYQQVCLAISYLHARGLIHRDIKPQNIMVGEFFEVYVMDFGLAKAIRSEIDTIRTDAGQHTAATVVQGTLAYMPPEQATGLDAVDEAADQFALGAVLFEILTYRPPYVGSEPEMWRAVLTGTFPRPADVAPGVAPALQEVCLRAMAFKKSDRYGSVRALADVVQDFLDGEKEAQRREGIALALLKESQHALRQLEAFEREAATLQARARDGKKALSPRATAEEREQVYRAEERARHMAGERNRAFTDVVRRFVRAIDVAPDNRRAKEMLADLCFRKMAEAEAEGRTGEAESYRTLVESYHDGKYARELQGDGTLRISSDPEGAHVYLARYVEHGGRLIPEDERYLGVTPTPTLALPMGSYVATLRCEGHPDVTHPFLVRRNESIDANVVLLTQAELVPGFIYVAAGPFLWGAQRVGEFDLERGHLDGFCVARNPVTLHEYLEFVNDVAARDGVAAALRHVPRASAGAGHYFPHDGSGFRIPEVDEDGDRWDPRWPVMAISALDADAYAAWRGQRDGVPFRLPTALEWEKAGRGADGRVFPWGNRWDDLFAHGGADGAIHAPEPVGRPTDVSPYGVLGLAGNVLDWTSSPDEAAPARRVLKGGGFDRAHATAMLGIRHHRRIESVSSDSGFRIAYTPPRP